MSLLIIFMSFSVTIPCLLLKSPCSFPYWFARKENEKNIWKIKIPHFIPFLWTETGANQHITYLCRLFAETLTKTNSNRSPAPASIQGLCGKDVQGSSPILSWVFPATSRGGCAPRCRCQTTPGSKSQVYCPQSPDLYHVG